ncbi:MAG TPA: bifunctional precorrin-2 dehydrogenase/sirohydrochlorin ferrochelatase [Acidobacteriaceae bacterium]|jgi:precorrin-2 dehydrogenase/sirohydrochlorin ferrochelatase|nr:bifunctional precorrin-2 dehydrogenase/sirohydrochlorin ferrochelatase [Acidobacteriaceae bacterium]
MTLLPVFLRLDRRPVVVIGAGTVALAKIESLLPTGAQLTVIAPVAVDAVQALARSGELVWHQRLFTPVDLDGAFLVIAATNDSAVNHAVYEEALCRNILCNAVDDPPNCDFYFGSTVARGDLQIAISTAGESPALAQRLRREIDERLPADLGAWLQQLGALRRTIRAKAPAAPGRTQLLHELAHRPLCEASTCPARQYAQQQIEKFRSEVPA